MGGDIYDAYKILPMAVMKADLWRYCVIYYYGGIYADTDTICMVNPNMFLKNDALLICAPENDVHLCQWIFVAPPKSPILLNVINMSVKRILTIPEIKGEHIIHYLTGPGVFTYGIESYLKENNYETFENRTKYFKYPHKILEVYEANHFHKNTVKHLFSGQHDDGWCKERDLKLK
jgi:mannosyltransferase OCH1-like enzyme